MATAPYRDAAPVDTSVKPDITGLKDKSVIVTGGASGFGEAYVLAFAKAGAYVTLADIDEKKGKAIAAASARIQFVKCDATNWDDQVHLFKAAVANSPHRSCDIVIANAGIIMADPIYNLDETDEPQKPNLKLVDINLTAVLYTTKLAMHYFVRQPDVPGRDRCLILKGSLGSYLDTPGNIVYNVTKWGVRSLMRNLRQSAWEHHMRVNLIAPWFVDTPILSDYIRQRIKDAGIEFGTVEGAVQAALRISCESKMNGRALCVVPESISPAGYKDIDHDDYKESDWLYKMEQELIAFSLHAPQIPK